MEGLPVGMRFEPNDQQIVGHYLRGYELGRPRSSLGNINERVDPYSTRPDLLPNIKENGSYYCTGDNKTLDRKATKRQTADGSGFWKAIDGQKAVSDCGQLIGCKRNLRFYYKPKNSTGWVMTEYTLHPNQSTNAPKAIWVIRKTQKRKGETGQGPALAAINPPSVSSASVDMDVTTSSFDDCMNDPACLINQAIDLDAANQQPQEFHWEDLVFSEDYFNHGNFLTDEGNHFW